MFFVCWNSESCETRRMFKISVIFAGVEGTCLVLYFVPVPVYTSVLCLFTVLYQVARAISPYMMY